MKYPENQFIEVCKFCGQSESNHEESIYDVDFDIIANDKVADWLDKYAAWEIYGYMKSKLHVSKIFNRCYVSLCSEEHMSGHNAEATCYIPLWIIKDQIPEHVEFDNHNLLEFWMYGKPERLKDQ